MFGIIEIPIWLAISGGLLMIFGLLDRVLVPSNDNETQNDYENINKASTTSTAILN